MQRFLKRPTPLAFCILFSGVCAEANAAIDPATVGQAVSVGASLFRQDPGEPNMEVVLANRSQLLAIQRRLDEIENGIVLILREFGRLDLRLIDANLDAERVKIGRQIYGRLLSFSLEREFIANIPLDSDYYGIEIRRYGDTLDRLIDDIGSWIFDYSQYQGSDGVGALSPAYVSYLDLTLRIERQNFFGGSKARITEIAKHHSEILGRVFDVTNDDSLVSMISEVDQDLRRQFGLLMVPLSQEFMSFGVDSRNGSVQVGCMTRYRRDEKTELIPAKAGRNQEMTITYDIWEPNETISLNLDYETNTSYGLYPVYEFSFRTAGDQEHSASCVPVLHEGRSWAHAHDPGRVHKTRLAGAKRFPEGGKNL